VPKTQNAETDMNAELHQFGARMNPRQPKADATQPEWLDLKALERYACVSERTLREWIHRPVDPLPAVRVGSKLLVRRSTFDLWLENHRLKPADLSCIVDEIVSGVTARN
jgi:excisionase family DNA binding protein